MRRRRRALAGALTLTLTLTLTFTLGLPAPASAHVSHTVQDGETLWSIATYHAGLTSSTIAAANGLDEDAPLAAGATIELPSTTGAAAVGGAAAQSDGAGATTSSSSGAHVVQPGDTLSAIALAAGVTTEALAAHNGLAADGVVVQGSVLELPAPSAAASVESPEQSAETTATAGSISSAEIARIAAEHGVPGDLAAALAWQESGFSNGVVSSAGAAGVMQILPSTWGWLQSDVVGEALDPASPSDNVRAGVVFLDQLLAGAGGDEAIAVAGYYQGAASVASEGIFPETQRYVDNVMALRSRFGG